MNIIIVEDDQQVHELFNELFKQPDYLITGFFSAENLLSVSYPVPDLFILDIMMPGMNGLDLCVLLKSDPALQHIPVLIMSSSPYVSKLAAYVNADGAFAKPVDVEHVKNIVEHYRSR